MTCQDCAITRENPLWALFNPACLHCGARLIRRIGKLPIAQSQARERRTKVLQDWMKHGHDEQAIRELVKAPGVPIQPTGQDAPKASGRQARVRHP